MSEKKPLLVHIPIPFTPSACLCDPEGCLPDVSLEVRREYIQALNREMLSAAGDMEDYKVIAIAFEGGGIQAFPPADVTVFVERIKRNFPMAAKPVVVLPCEPCNIDPLKAANYRHLGASLMDVRLFSAIRSECENIGRVFPHYSLKEPAEALRSFLLDNMGVQVALGIEGQTAQTLAFTLEQCVKYDSVHITLMEIGDAAELGEFADGWLIEKGFSRYAPGRYAKPGWDMPFYPLGATEVLGLGVSAVSLMDGLRSRNTGDMALYIASAEDYTKITDSVEPIASSQA